MLSTNVKTTGDLMSIALQAEREAIRRYSQLSARMREAGNESAAALFDRMVIEEQEHERLLLEWMVRESIDENPDIDPISWSDPQVATTYDDEARNPHRSTPYKALAFAVHNEEVAFRFYTHVAAESDNETVRKYAEILAREELGHAALLRAERRRAYHTERDTGSVEPVLDPRAIHNEADLLAAAIHIDRSLTDTMGMITADSPQLLALARKPGNRSATMKTLLVAWRAIVSNYRVKKSPLSLSNSRLTQHKWRKNPVAWTQTCSDSASIATVALLSTMPSSRTQPMNQSCLLHKN